MENSDGLPFIPLATNDDLKHKKTKRGHASLSYPPISEADFKNMLTETVSVGSVKVDNSNRAYFLIELSSPYFSPAVSELLNELKLDLKTVLNETLILVGGGKSFLEGYIEKARIKKKITTLIRNIRLLDEKEKIGRPLQDLMSKDVDKTKTFSISISLIDNLSEAEQDEFNQILFKELKSSIGTQHLPNSNKFICGSSSSRILGLAKYPFIKKISLLPKLIPDSESASDIVVPSNEIKIIPATDVPTICVIDSGISEGLLPYCIETDHIIFPDIIDRIEHGTKVASVALFGMDLLKLKLNKNMPLKQRSNLICVKLDDKDGGKSYTIEEAIKYSIDKYHTRTKVFNLSYSNLEESLDPNERLELAAKLDTFIQKYNVILVNSCGNIDPSTAVIKKSEYPHYLSAFPVLSPSESKNIFSVGSICLTSTQDSCVPSRLTRIGLLPIFYNDDLDRYRFFKPDICSFGGNSDLRVSGITILPSNLNVAVIDGGGNLVLDMGTSFAAPLISLAFARLYQKYGNIYSNSETYKAILLNKAHLGDMNNHPLFYLLDIDKVTECNDAVYVNFEGEVTPKYRSEELKNIEIFQCKTVEFYVPSEAESFDIKTVHSNNYKFQDLRKYNTRLVAELIKPNGTSAQKDYGTPNRNCPNTYAHYSFSRNYVGTWKVKVHFETRGIPREMLKDIQVRFGVSIKINLRKSAAGNLKTVYNQVLENSKTLVKVMKVPIKVPASARLRKV